MKRKITTLILLLLVVFCNSQVCEKPLYLSAYNLTPYGAELYWNGSSESYTIEYGLKGFAVGSGTVITSITAPPYIIPSGLTPSTEYDCYITGVCDSGTTTSEISDPIPFTTNIIGSVCSAPIEITSIPFIVADNTKKYGNNILDGYPSCNNISGFLGGEDVVYNYTNSSGTDQILALTLDPLKSKGMSMFVYETCVDVGTNCLYSVANYSSAIRRIPEVTVADGKSIYIVISAISGLTDPNYKFAIQNANCKAPINLTASKIDLSSSKLSWEELGTATSWEVFVQNEGEGLPTTNGEIAVNPNNFIATKLTETSALLLPDTGYQYWVRSDCGSGSYSNWVGPFSFNMTSCATTCEYTFKLLDSGGDGWNGTSFEIIQNGFIVATIGNDFTSGYEKTKNVSLCDGIYQIYWNGGLTNDYEVGLQVINSFGQTIYNLDQTLVYPNSTIITGNITCGMPECLPPTNLIANNVTNKDAELNWQPNGPSPASWDIYIMKSGDPAPDSTSIPTEKTTTFPYIKTTTLEEGVSYDFYVRSDCGSFQLSEWSKPSTFTTTELCKSPKDFTVVSSNLNSIDFTWTGELGSTYQYIVLPFGSMAPSITDPAWDLNNTTATSLTVTGLKEATRYDFYIRSVCAATLFSKNIKTSVSTASCLPENKCNYTFILTTNQEGGWNVLNQEMEIRQAGAAVAKIGPDFGSGEGFEKTVNIPLCPGVPFEIYWKEGGAYFMEIGLSIKDAVGNSIFYLAPTNLNRLKPGTIIFTDTPVCKVPTCIAPTTLFAKNILNTSAQISWKENNGNPFIPWDILILPASALPPTQDATGWKTVNSNPHDLSGLDPNTEYKVYVRSNCSGTDQSYWSSAVNFRTLGGNPKDYCDYIFVLKTSVSGSTWHPDMSMSVIQGGVEIKRLTPPPTAHSGGYPVKVPLLNSEPFELYWNKGGIFDYLVGIDILDADGGLVYSKDFGIGEQGTSLYTGTTTCTPNPCPSPIQLNTSNSSDAQITLGWTAIGTPDKYEVLVLPRNSKFPAPDATGAVETNTNSFVATVTSGLIAPGVLYEFYVRPICDGGDRVGNWSGPEKFNLTLSNDDCDKAIVIPVNPSTALDKVIDATIAGATESSKALTCSGEGFGTVVPDDDVWYEFTATSTNHGIIIGNITGTPQEPYAVLSYQLFAPNTCQMGTAPLICQRYNDVIIAKDLIPGQTYKLRIYTFDVTPSRELGDLTINFKIGIITLPNYVKIDPIANSTPTEAQTSVENLVNNVLLNGTCGTASNISFSTGFQYDYSPYGGTGNGIGSFDKNGSTFGLKQGIVLATGTTKRGEGPVNGFQGDGGIYWPGWTSASGDDDLNKVLDDNNLTGISLNSTKLEFDFVPTVDKIDLNFVFASQDYGLSDCNKVSDAFIVLLTDENGNTKNIAVVPGTTKPISVSTINNNEFYNDNFVDGVDPNLPTDDCSSSNPAYFDRYFVPLAEYLTSGGTALPGESPFASPTSYSGYTKPLKATSSVIPGKKYHIKLAIADLTELYEDWGHDAAVFIGSFDFEKIDLGADLLKSNGSAICAGSTKVLDSKLDPAKFNIIWKKDDAIISGQTNPTLIINAPGKYEVSSTYKDITCSGPITGNDTILVEYYDDFVPGTPANITECSTTSTAEFDLTKNSTSILGSLGANYSVLYFTSENDATNNVNAIASPNKFSNTANPQTIFTRVSNSTTGCYKIVSFDLLVADLTPKFTLTSDFELCEYKTATINVTPLNYTPAEVTYAWKLNGNILAYLTKDIDANKGGKYEVTVANAKCSTTKAVNVSILTPVNTNFAEIPSICKNAVAPILESVSPNGVSGIWTPNVIDTKMTGVYEFTPNNDQCATTQTLDVDVNLCAIQKGISPNNDGMNDFFDLSTFEVKHLTLFNRYGTKVYSLENYTNEWHGQLNDGKDLPDGTYYYVLEQKNEKSITGWIYITH
jgi:gliding motility-associated-like protein